jgi:flagellar assembly protein FliH
MSTRTAAPKGACTAAHVTFLLAVHHEADLTIASTSPVVPAAQVPELESALSLAQEMARLHADLQQSVEAQRQAAAEEGFRAGHAQGLAQAQDEVSTRLADSIDGLLRTQAAQRDELKAALVDLATAMVHRALAGLGPEVVVPALLARTFESLAPSQPIQITLAPRTLDAVRPAVQASHPHLQLRWVANEAMAPWACEVETDSGRLLAGLDDVLGNMAQALRLQQRRQPPEAAESGE